MPKPTLKLLFLLALTLLLTPHLPAQGQYENLVFEGAGIRGIAYSGVIEQLEAYGMMKDLKKAGGTSAGAITAMMVALGYEAEEIYPIISGTRFQQFNDGGWGFVGGIHRMKKRFGWYKTKRFDQWLEGLIEAKTGAPDITFAEMARRGYKDLHVTGTCLNRQTLLVFSAATYPNMKVKDAVKVSMSIPLYFEASFIDAQGRLYKNPDAEKQLDIVIDGGILGNFPIGIFDDTRVDSYGVSYRVPNPKTLGVRIDADQQIENDQKGLGLAHQEINDLKSYIEAFYILTLESLNRQPLTPEDWERTLSVSSVGISPKIKRLSAEEKERLRQRVENRGWWIIWGMNSLSENL
jgi:NTE family protein